MVTRAIPHRQHRNARTLAACCLAVVTITGLTAGCSSSKSTPSATPAVGAADRAQFSGGTGGGADTGAGKNAAAPPQAKPANPAPSAPNNANPLTNVAAAGRSLVYTASLTVRTKDVQGATANAEHLALANGGFVGDEKASSGTVPDVAGITQSTVTLRVPADKFDTVLSQLGNGGTILAQSRSASDVTDQVVDTSSRITTAQASIARITELMKAANGLTDVVALEGELSRREADLESLKARLATLTDQVQLSTITVTYQVPEAPAPAGTTVTKKQNALQRGLHDGWTAFLAVVKVLLIVAGAVLPFVVLAVVLWWPARRLQRWRASGFAWRAPKAVTGPGGSGGPSGPPAAPAQRASGDLSNASAAADADGSK